MTAARFLVLALCVYVAGDMISAASADDKGARDRKSRAALALAGAKAESPANLAPAPRVARAKDYPTGYAESLAEQRPLVVFVGCDPHPVPGAIVARTEAKEFAEITAPAVVVGYPVGGKLLIEKKLAGCPPVEDLKKLVDSAQQKVDVPPLKEHRPAPPPLNWQIRAVPYASPAVCVGAV